MEDSKQQIIDSLKQANNILVTVKRSPTIDALAACIGLTLVLNEIDKHGTAVFSGEVPSVLEFLEPDKTLERNTNSLQDFIISLDKSKADKLRYKIEDSVVKIFITPYRTSISDKDLDFSQGDFNVDVVVALGVHNQDDLDEAITSHGRILHDATVVSIDTETGGGEDLGTINWVDANASSLSEMVAVLAGDLGKEDLIDNQVATALLTGIVSETERFSNAKTSPDTMKTAGLLLSAGANQELVATKLSEPSKPAESDTATEVNHDDDSHDDDHEDDNDGGSPVDDDEPPKDPGTIEIEHSGDDEESHDDHKDDHDDDHEDKPAEIEISSDIAHNAEPLAEEGWADDKPADKPEDKLEDKPEDKPAEDEPEHLIGAMPQPTEDKHEDDKPAEASADEPKEEKHEEVSPDEPVIPMIAPLQAEEPAKPEADKPAEPETLATDKAEEAPAEAPEEEKHDEQAPLLGHHGHGAVIQPLHDDSKEGFPNGAPQPTAETATPPSLELDPTKFAMTPPILGGTLTAANNDEVDPPVQPVPSADPQILQHDGILPSTEENPATGSLAPEPLPQPLPAPLPAAEAPAAPAATPEPAVVDAAPTESLIAPLSATPEPAAAPPPAPAAPAPETAAPAPASPMDTTAQPFGASLMPTLDQSAPAPAAAPAPSTPPAFAAPAMQAQGMTPGMNMAAMNPLNQMGPMGPVDSANQMNPMNPMGQPMGQPNPAMAAPVGAPMGQPNGMPGAMPPTGPPPPFGQMQ